MADYSDILSALGGSDSNSYVSGFEADSFAAFSSWNAAWLGQDGIRADDRAC